MLVRCTHVLIVNADFPTCVLCLRFIGVFGGVSAWIAYVQRMDRIRRGARADFYTPPRKCEFCHWHAVFG